MIGVGVQYPSFAWARGSEGFIDLEVDDHDQRETRLGKRANGSPVEGLLPDLEKSLGRSDSPPESRGQDYAPDHLQEQVFALYSGLSRFMKPRHLISLKDYSRGDIEEIFTLAEQMKARPSEFKQALLGKTLAMIFQKPSTRTRVSFEVGMFQLGGLAVVLNHDEIHLSVGESVADTARVLSTFADGIMARVFAHQDVLDLAKFGSKPVVNGLSDLLHPCQALADFFTLREHFGSLSGLRIAYVGDGNNVCHELMIGAARLGVEMVIATPTGFEPNPLITKSSARDAQKMGSLVARLVKDPLEAVAGARAVYTDVWTSMGQEAQATERREAFSGFTVDSAMMAAAADDAIFMHCLPAHRGLEVTDEVMDGPRSVVFQQAGNRLHAQKAALTLLMGSA
jgi:ornithine carbamoyltransferase